jgi:predicted dehydrogenase
MEKIKAGLIGCGRMGAFTSEKVRKNAPSFWFPLSHYDALMNHPFICEIAASDGDENNLGRMGTEYDLKNLYLNPLEMLQDFKPDLLTIATRTNGRALLIKQGVESGVRALHIEKPLCNSMKELSLLEALLKNSNIYATYGAIRRFLPVYQNAVKIAKSGEYGNLKEIKISFGSAMLFWTHPHAIDLMLYAASGSKVIGVQAFLAGVSEGLYKTNILSDPLVISATVYFESGLTGCITQSLGSDMTLTCEDAEISVRGDGHVTDIYKAQAGKTYPVRRPLAIDNGDVTFGGTFLAIDELIGCLRGDKDRINSNAENKKDILLGQRVIFAMVQSHIENSRIIDLEEIDPQMKIEAITNGKFA